MPSYLLAWNPIRWEWIDLAEMSQDVKNGKHTTMRWSCGNSGRLAVGDRVFFIRLGEQPKGIFASGRVIKESYKDRHWDDDKAKLGQTSMFVQVSLDALLDPATDIILPRDLLNSAPFSQMHWDTQISGVQILDNIANELEKAWVIFVGSSDLRLPEEVEQTEKIFEGAIHQITVNAYERNAEARRKCIAHYGSICCVCSFDFAKVFGEIGHRFIHVHHLRQVSEIGERYQVDPIRDLHPVCPNCHAMIHRRNPPYSIQELQNILKQTKQK